MKKLFKAAAVSLGIVGMLSTSPAHSREFADVYSECGLGAMIFSGASDNNRILAIISNVTWDLGTTAHLSNMSSPENCTKGSASTAAFIMQTYPSIERDLARGEGEFLTAMLDFRGCETGAQPGIIADLRTAMATEIGGAGYADSSGLDKAGVLYNTLESTLQNGHTKNCVI